MPHLASRCIPSVTPPATWSNTNTPTTCSRSKAISCNFWKTFRPITGTFPPCDAETLDKGHGRVEQRSIRVTQALNAYLDFPHVRQVWRIERRVTTRKSGITRTEVVYGITSLPPERASPADLLVLNRSHWRIEALHWVRDVSFDEDRCQVRTRHAPHNLATLRNLVIGLLRRLFDIRKTSFASAMRYSAARPCTALDLFLA